MVNRVLLFSSMVLLMIVVIVGVFAPDLPLYLRTQIAAQFANPASLTKTFTWTPTNDDLGEKTLTIVATDDNGNTTTKEVTVNVVEKPVGITNVQVAVEDTQATMTWETASTFLAAVEFDVNSNLRERQDASSQTPALTHSVVLSNLRPCTTYTYRVVAVDATIGDTPDITRNFTTTGCTGGAVVTGTTQADISTSGGEVSLPDKITVQVPSGAIGQDATFQVHQLNRDTALASIGSPDSLSPVTGLYQLGAFSNVSTSVDTFSEPVQVTLHYTPASDTNISTLKIARYDGSSWQDLSDCSVDEGNQTVTCATTAFSAFAGFAAGSTSPDSDPEPSPTPPPSDNNDNHSGGGGGGGGSGGGGGESGGGDSGRPEKRNTTVTYQVESGHKIEGSFSGIVRDGSQVVAKLAHEKSLLSKSVSVPKNDYWLDVRVKHDRPGPVDMAIYINNTAWKVIRLPRADNKYYVHRIGLLRNFRGATVRFRMLHDDFAKNDPTNEELDRNLYIDWWRLTTDSHISTSGSATGTTTARQAASKPVAGGRSAGWALLPHLNDYIREELGSQNVKLATWKYYAWRLTVPTNNRASIQTDTHLRTVMRYWKGASPAKPYGETF